MCRRSGCIGLREGEAWAVGTIGLLDAPDVAAREASARWGPSSLVIALVAWPVVTPQSSLTDARGRRLLSLSIQRPNRHPHAHPPSQLRQITESILYSIVNSRTGNRTAGVGVWPTRSLGRREFLTPLGHRTPFPPGLFYTDRRASASRHPGTWRP